MTVEESAAALGVSPTTVKRDFDFAVKWLGRRLRGKADAR
jgi:DeoR/GlpR family transcriptional regulator of sugar metabolism